MTRSFLYSCLIFLFASLVRMALFRVSEATENDTKARVKLLAEALTGLYGIMSGLWSWNLKPIATGGDG